MAVDVMDPRKGSTASTFLNQYEFLLRPNFFLYSQIIVAHMPR